MPKDRQKQKGPRGVPNRHLHARTSFLFQAATYLALQTATQTPDEAQQSESSNQRCQANALRLASHLRAVSLKGQARLSSDMKRAICKSCNAVMIPGQTSTHVLENTSKGGKKPWADVMVIQCSVCCTTKRFPVGATRQQRKAKRDQRKETEAKQKATSVKTDITVSEAASAAG